MPDVAWLAMEERVMRRANPASLALARTSQPAAWRSERGAVVALAGVHAISARVLRALTDEFDALAAE